MKLVANTQQARQLLRMSPEQAAQKLDALPLEQRRELVLSLPPGRQRQDLILLSAAPGELVQSLSPEDFVITVKAIGEVDALELLELSSDEQVGYLADLELWTQDGLDLSRLAWLNELMFRCSEERCGRWFDHLDFEILALLFERSVVPVDREQIDDLPDRLANRVVSPDNYHLLVVKLGADVERVGRLVEFLYRERRELFLALWGNLGTVPPAEIEQQARRWRDGRLADRGWPELEDAWQLLATRDPAQVSAGPLPGGWPDPPRAALQLAAEQGGLLGRALSRVDNPERVAAQLANLVNRLIVLEGWPPAEPESLERAARLLDAYLELGLEAVGAPEPAAAARMLEQVPLLHLFQAARHQVERLARRARSLQRDWQAWLPLLDEPLPEILQALSVRWPAYFDAQQLASIPFRSGSQLLAAERQLQLLEAYLVLGRAAGVAPELLPNELPPGSFPPDRQSLTLSVLLVTMFGRWRLGLEARLQPLPLEHWPALAESLPHNRQELERLFQDWSEQLLRDPPPGLPALHAVLAGLLLELLAIEPTRLDPRYAVGIWLQAPATAS